MTLVPRAGVHRARPRTGTIAGMTGQGDTVLDVGTGVGRDPTVVAYLTALQT
jgi:ubiquinone/menaquinone biosynthesis C-methylase UbiE